MQTDTTFSTVLSWMEEGSNDISEEIYGMKELEPGPVFLIYGRSQ